MSILFSCDCGFIYQRIGPDKSEEDRFRYDSIREYGTTWENKLKEMWNDLSLSRAKIARRLKISDLSITNIAHRLNFPINFPMNTSGARISNDRAHRKTPRMTLSDARETYRKERLRVVEENPEANRNKLIKLANHEYLWLMRNDTEWIMKHLPAVLKVPRQREHLDWQKIDDELSVKVEKACKEIYSEIPIKRVGITEIMRRIGYKKWIEKRELKLPKTTQIINKRLESQEHYKIRKLKSSKAYAEEQIIPYKRN